MPPVILSDPPVVARYKFGIAVPLDGHEPTEELDTRVILMEGNEVVVAMKQVALVTVLGHASDVSAVSCAPLKAPVLKYYDRSHGTEHLDATADYMRLKALRVELDQRDPRLAVAVPKVSQRVERHALEWRLLFAALAVVQRLVSVRCVDKFGPAGVPTVLVENMRVAP